MSDDMLDADAFEDQGAHQTTVVGLVIDRSGSMGPMWEEALSGLNAQVRDLQERTWESEEDRPHDIVAVLVSFNNTAKVHVDGLNIEDVPEITEEEIRPDGMTALRDGMGLCMDRMEAIKTVGDDVAYLLFTITDGQENASQNVSPQELAERIKEREGAGNWTFTFMGTDKKAFDDAAKLGVRSTNMAAYGGATGQSIGAAYQVNAVATRGFMASRSKGVTQTSNFFDDTEDANAAPDVE